MDAKLTVDPPRSPTPAAAEGAGARSNGAAADLESVEITDSKGRKLRIREPDILTESRLVKAMGEASSNVSYMTGYVMPAAMVVAIDGEELPFPFTEREVDAAIKRLGRQGMRAVMEHVIAKVQSPEASRADIKK